MVSKKYGENEVRMMFSSFGQMEECRILRGPDGQSRGRCDFSIGTVVLATLRHLQHCRVGPSQLLRFNPVHPQIKYYSPHSLSSHHCDTQPPHLTLKGHCTRCPAQWLVALATAGCWCSWAQLAGGSAQLLLYHLLHHTLQRLELACRRIFYIALCCIMLRKVSGTELLS